MAETQYEIIEAAQPKFPVRSLIRISGDRKLITSLKAFGPNYFSKNVEEMQKPYSHPQTGEIISFREPTTAESVVVAFCDFENRAKPQILDPRWLQLGRIVRTSKGIFANPPKDSQGNSIIDEQTLKSFLKADRKLNGIWLLDNYFGYAPYETFKQGIQDGGDFAESGLAKVLEHSQFPEKLKEIASKRNYSKGVDVVGFGNIREPFLEVAGLYSGRYLGYRRLNVSGDYWYDHDNGCAFGVLE